MELDNGFVVYPSQWDRPQALASTLEGAKAHAEELDALAPVPAEDWTDQPVYQPEGDLFEPYSTGTDIHPPERVSACDWCESPSLPTPVKPIRGTAPWWIDPEPFWRCPECLSPRGDVHE